jgi:cation:H+ antiporter
MEFIPEESLLINLIVIAIAFVILSKSASFLVDGAVGMAYEFRLPKMIIGIVLVGFATTAPEFTVSLISSLEGYPEIALGNAVGSVIADNAFALSMGILVAPAAISVHSRTLSIYGLFLLAVSVLTFVLVLNGVISRVEGLILLVLLVGYLAFMFWDEKRRRRNGLDDHVNEDLEEHRKPGTLAHQIGRFLIGVVGIIIASRFLVDSAVNTAKIFHVSEAVIGLTIVAIGTSLPEIATCIVASRKGHGDLAFGDILGANLLNLLWIIGAAATARPISVSQKVIFFSFPSMLFFVLLLLVFTWTGFKLEKWEGVVLFVCYIAYTGLAIVLLYLNA